jgi:hypothetical protein
MGELGFLGLRYDPRWGGAGLDWTFTAVLFEELTRCDNAGVVMGISVQTDMATPSLHRFGSDALREQYLAPAIRGEQVTAIAVTEPAAGSDVAGIKTRAVRDGDDWVINGSKIYITNAATADWLCLLAVTNPDAGYGGFSQILVPTDVPGFRYELLDKIGNWGSDTGQLFFEDVRVPWHGWRRTRAFSSRCAVPGRALVPVVIAGLGPPSVGADLMPAGRFRPATRQDAGEPLQVRRDADPDQRCPGPRTSMHRQDGAWPGHHARRVHGEGLLRQHEAVRVNDVRAALWRERLHLGEPGRARLRRLAARHDRWRRR